MATPPPLPSAVRAALQSGQTIEAIKLYREASGLGLKEAKDVIDAHLRGTARPATAASFATTGAFPPAVQDAMKRGKKIEAIRLLREQTGMGLAAAKAAVEALDLGRSAGHQRSPGEEPRSGAGMWLSLALGAAALAGYYFFKHSGG